MTFAQIWRERARHRLAEVRAAMEAARGERVIPWEPRPRDQPRLVHFGGAADDGEGHPAMRMRG